MAKKIILFAFFVASLGAKVNGQKKLLEHSTYTGWPIIESPAISNDGRFVKYAVEIPNRGVSLIAQATDLSWKQEITHVTNSVFTADSRRIIFTNGGDSLGIWNLATDSIRYISQVMQYNVPDDGTGAYMAYQLKDSPKTLVLLNLMTGHEKLYPAIDGYAFSKQGRILLMVATLSKDSIPMQDILRLDLATDKIKTICHSVSWTARFEFDEAGIGVAFLTKGQGNGQNEVCLRYYKDGMDSADIVAGPSTPGLEGMSVMDYNITFSKRGEQLFFDIEHKDSNKGASIAHISGAQVSIRGMHDIDLRYNMAKGPFLATVNLNNNGGHVVRLQQERDKDRAFCIDENPDWIVTEGDIVGDPKDSKWNISARPDIYLVSTKDGSRRLLEKRLFYYNMYISPTGKYIIWFNQELRQWFSHNIDENRTRNITASICTPVYWENDCPDLPRAPDIAGWLENDLGVLIYDRYDIWKVDLNGVKFPVNITHHFGARNKIRFHHVNFRGYPLVVGMQDTLLLSAFDLRTKQDGFFQLTMRDVVLSKLVMSSHIYSSRSKDFSGANSSSPTFKAKYTDIYLLQRMSATEYPNLYITHDFKDFKALTDFAPQKEYNWYRTELVHWRLPSGKPGEGILFKPENFNPKGKYPIIFYYYEKKAFNLNIFIHPRLSEGTLNIPSFVSNGYLVFVPDIYYQIGHPGQSACNSVVSAGLYLAKKPWVDAKRMGLQGHSFGGFETNYIVSHSSLFAAAAPASGSSNEISSYGETGITWYFERRQGRIGATLWERPDLYIENSAVFKANKVSAPILIMHTKDDWIVPYSQGLQWYNMLHRAGKKAWLLSYDGEEHTLRNPKSQLDYSIRLGQFFDHYLKGAPAPKWMTLGVLPSMKGKDDGLELDMSGRKP